MPNGISPLVRQPRTAPAATDPGAGLDPISQALVRAATGTPEQNRALEQQQVQAGANRNIFTPPPPLRRRPMRAPTARAGVLQQRRAVKAPTVAPSPPVPAAPAPAAEVPSPESAARQALGGTREDPSKVINALGSAVNKILTGGA